MAHEHEDVLALEAVLSLDAGYRLLPFRFGRIPGVVGKVLLASDAGEFLFLSEDDFQSFIAKQLPIGSDLFFDLEAKEFLVEVDKSLPIRRMASKYRTKKCFLRCQRRSKTRPEGRSRSRPLA